MKDRSNVSQVARVLTLISQIGITMLTSIFLCGAIGYFIDNKFGTSTLIFFIILGILGGYRGVYSLVKGFIRNGKTLAERNTATSPDSNEVKDSDIDKHVSEEKHMYRNQDK